VADGGESRRGFAIVGGWKAATKERPPSRRGLAWCEIHGLAWYGLGWWRIAAMAAVTAHGSALVILDGFWLRLCKVKMIVAMAQRD